MFADGRLYSHLVRKGSAHGSIIGDQRGNECPHCGPDDPRRICSTDLDKVGAAVDIAQRKVSKGGHGKSLSRAIYLCERSGPKAGVKGAGRRFCFETAKSSKGKDLRPCLHEYRPTDRVRARSTSCSPRIVSCPRSWRRWRGLGAQLLMQAALEAEVTEFLGRDRYQRSATAADARSGARNGYRPATVKTTAGPITLERPKLCGTTAVFSLTPVRQACLQDRRAGIVGDRLVCTRLSVRDVEATLADALRDQAAISESTVAQVCQRSRPSAAPGRGTP